MNLLIRAANIYMPAALKKKKLEELFACTATAFGCEMPRLQGLPYDEMLRSYARFTAAQANQALLPAIPDVLSLAAHRGSATPDVLPIPVTAQANSPEPLLPRNSRHGDCFAGSPPQRRAVDHPARNDCSASYLPGRILPRRDGQLALTPEQHRGAPSRRRAEIQNRLYNGAYRMGEQLRHTFRVKTTADALAAARVLYRALGIDLRTTPSGEVTVHSCFFSEFYSSPVCRLIASLDEGLFAGLSGGGQLSFTQRITEGRDCCKAEFRPFSSEDIMP